MEIKIGTVITMSMAMTNSANQNDKSGEKNSLLNRQFN